MSEKMVRIKYWDDSPRVNGFTLTGLLPRKAAEALLKTGAYPQAEIVEDSVGK